MDRPVLYVSTTARKRQPRQTAMRLVLKFGFCIALLLCLAITLNSFLNDAKFRSLYESVEQSRFEILARDVTDTIERGLLLGFHLGQIDTVQTVLDRVQGTYTDIVHVAVHDAQGVPAYEAGDGARDADGTVLPGLRIVSQEIVNSFDRVEGTVVLYYTTEEREATLAAARREQLGIAGIALAAAAAIGLLAAFLLLHRITARFSTMARSAQRLGETEWHGGPGEVEAWFPDMTVKAREARRALADIERQVEDRA